MIITRETTNPIIKPGDIEPSNEDLEVLGVFNTAAVEVGGRTFLLLRVTERPVSKDPDKVIVPYYDASSGRMMRKTYDKHDTGIDFSDPRSFRENGRLRLTSMGHLRGAWSDDGIHFDIKKKPSVFSTTAYEAYGCEDPRISMVDGKYVLTYTAVSENGICSALAVSEDLEKYDKKGIIFLPNNRNINIFPEKINGYYVAFHRPITDGWCRNSIWLAYSPDLLHWGGYKRFFTPGMTGWCNGKVGAGAPPIKTDKGWLVIYHGVEEIPSGSKKEKYSLGVMLLDADNPERVIGTSKGPILTPEERYEKEGFVPDVVFTCGAVRRGNGNIDIYYGAADETVCLATIHEKELLDNVA